MRYLRERKNEEIRNRNAAKRGEVEQSTDSVMTPRIVTIKWGQCDFCSKWRIVDRDLEEDESFCCTDIPGKSCDSPEDTVDQVHA